MPGEAAYPALSGYGQFDRPEEARGDLRAFGFIVVPALAVAGLLYLAGAAQVAVGLAAAGFIISVIVAPQIGLYAYLAWQALDSAVITEEGASFTPAKAFAALLLLVYVFWYGRGGARLSVSKPTMRLLLLFGAFGLVTAPLAVDPLLALRYAGQIIVQALLAVMMLHMLHTAAHVRRALLWTVLGGVGAAVFMLVTGGLTKRYSRATLGEYANPNTTAVALCIALIAIPAAWVYAKRMIDRVWLLAAAPVLFVAMLKAGSRSATLAVFAALTMGVLLPRGARFWKRALVTMFGMAVAVVTFFAALQSDILGKESQARIEELVHEGSTVAHDSRLDIWRSALHTYLRRPVFGFGYGNTAEVLARSQGIYIDVHSSYLGPLVDGGPIAFGLMMLALWRLMVCVRRIGPSRAGMPAAMILIVMLISASVHTLHFSKWFWVPVTLCLLLAEQAEREKTAMQQWNAVGGDARS